MANKMLAEDQIRTMARMDPSVAQEMNKQPATVESMTNLDHHEAPSPENITTRLEEEKERMMGSAIDQFEEQKRSDAVDEHDILSMSVKLEELPFHADYGDEQDPLPTRPDLI